MTLNITYDAVVAAFRLWCIEAVNNPDYFMVFDDSSECAEDMADAFLHYLEVAEQL